MKLRFFTIVTLCASFLALRSNALASTWYVNGVSGSNTNTCTSPTSACKTITYAISLASAGDTIIVAPAVYTEHLSVSFSLKIVGSGASKTIIDGGGAFGTVVTIPNTNVHLTLSRLTIQHGRSVVGGGISNHGTLTIIDSAVSSNTASLGGGGIANLGALVINRSLIAQNYATEFCFFGHCHPGNGGGISSSGSLTIINSTINANSALNSGGGIFSSGSMSISNSTLSGNSASQGGAINAGSGILQNTVLANNSGGDCNGPTSSNGYNISSDSTCNLTGPGDMNNTDPLLGPLQNNGGLTQTMALLPGSPAIDAGNPSGCTDGQGHLLKTDQRGKPRPDPEDAGGCDIGAYESQSD